MLNLNREELKFPPDHNTHLWARVPEHLRDGLLAYMTGHRPTGGFLMAVLENDLFLAVQRADQVTRRSMYDICIYIFNCAPAQCFGSVEKVEAWVKQGERLAGKF